MLDASVTRPRQPTTPEDFAVFEPPSPPPVIIFESPPASPEPLPLSSTSAGSLPSRPPLESSDDDDASYTSDASGASDDTTNPALDDREELIYVDNDIFTVAAHPPLPRSPRRAAASAYPVIIWIGHRPPPDFDSAQGGCSTRGGCCATRGNAPPPFIFTPKSL